MCTCVCVCVCVHDYVWEWVCISIMWLQQHRKRHNLAESSHTEENEHVWNATEWVAWERVCVCVWWGSCVCGTCREGQEGVSLSEAALLVQEVMRVEPVGRRPLLLILQHRRQQRNHRCALHTHTHTHTHRPETHHVVNSVEQMNPVRGSTPCWGSFLWLSKAIWDNVCW